MRAVLPSMSLLINLKGAVRLDGHVVLPRIKKSYDGQTRPRSRIQTTAEAAQGLHDETCYWKDDAQVAMRLSKVLGRHSRNLYQD